jgi:branched-chain amino acid transport system ATP-binding protein
VTGLVVRGVGKSFGGVRALEAVDLDVAPGTIVGLMGANGAGKTTLFGVIAGNERVDAGTISFEGRRIDGLRPDRVAALGVARTFQIVRPFRGLSVRDNVLVAARFGRRPRDDDPAATTESVLADLGLAAQAERPAGALTLADQKRLELARAVATGARLILVDEVMAGLNATEVAAMLDVIARLHRERGLTLLVVEHVMQALMRLAQRIVVLHQGRVIAEGEPAAIAADARVIEAYLGVAS